MLAGILIVAGANKALDPNWFISTIISHGIITSPLYASIGSIILIIGELSLAIWLMVTVINRGSLLLPCITTILLFTLFIIYAGIIIIKGSGSSGCGCGLGHDISWELIIFRNLILCLIAFVAIIIDRYLYKSAIFSLE